MSSKVQQLKNYIITIRRHAEELERMIQGFEDEAFFEHHKTREHIPAGCSLTKVEWPPRGLTPAEFAKLGERNATFPQGAPTQRAVDAARIRNYLRPVVLQGKSVVATISVVANILCLSDDYVRSLCIPENEIEVLRNDYIRLSPLAEHKADLDAAKDVRVGLEQTTEEAKRLPSVKKLEKFIIRSGRGEWCAWNADVVMKHFGITLDQLKWVVSNSWNLAMGTYSDGSPTVESIKRFKETDATKPRRATKKKK